LDRSGILVRVKETLKVGDVFENPGGGISTIKIITDNKIYYIRGSSTLSLDISAIEGIYDRFKGSICSTSDLKVYNPKIFDSKASGHSCNCTFLFTILKRLGIAGNIMGEGKRNSPFYIDIK